MRPDIRPDDKKVKGRKPDENSKAVATAEENRMDGDAVTTNR